MKLLPIIFPCLLVVDGFADQKISSGPFTCSIPDDWKKQEVANPSSLLFVSPKSLKFGTFDDTDMPVMVVFTTIPDSMMSAKQHKEMMEKEIAVWKDEMQEMVETARTGHGLLRQEDLDPPKLETVMMDGKEILKFTKVFCIRKRIDIIACKDVSYSLVKPNEINSFMISGPLGLIKDYSKEINNILESLKLSDTAKSSPDKSPSTSTDKASLKKEP